MAFIDHRCPCGHIALRHGGAPIRCLAGRGCDANDCGPTEDTAPEVVPTWDAAGRPVAAIVPPGEVVSGLGRTCDCGACRELYEAETGQPAPEPAGAEV
ncbi:hypothetical protein [Streptomyces sp. URMC 129]|uniref:hypothetical protein n=1 Tax=Streptomyces sp. URMC 129 TaxID=3423407 RepID=UPI003F1C8721